MESIFLQCFCGGSGLVLLYSRSDIFGSLTVIWALFCVAIRFPRNTLVLATAILYILVLGYYTWITWKEKVSNSNSTNNNINPFRKPNNNMEGGMLGDDIGRPTTIITAE